MRKGLEGILVSNSSLTNSSQIQSVYYSFTSGLKHSRYVTLPDSHDFFSMIQFMSRYFRAQDVRFSFIRISYGVAN